MKETARFASAFLWRGYLSVRAFLFGMKRSCFPISNMTHQINEEIRDKEVRLISSEGEQLGIMSSKAALALDVYKRQDGDRVDVVGLQQLGVVGGHHALMGDQHLAGDRIEHVLQGIAALDALRKGLNGLTVFDDLGDGDALGRAAVVLDVYKRQVLFPPLWA